METALLEKIATNTEKTARNTEPKCAFHILLSERKTCIKTKFRPVIELDKNKKYEMALVNLETYYSFPNIDVSNNNFRYSPDKGTTWFDIAIPEGSYELTDIITYLHRIMKENGHNNLSTVRHNITLEPNNNTLKCVLILATDFEVDFTTTNSIRTVLGFNAQVYKSGYHESENLINILNVSSLIITSDIIGSSYINGTTENIIYSFFPNVSPGYKIIEVPVNLVYLPITLQTLSSMETQLQDQTGKLINLRGEELSIRFHIREI